MPNKNQLIKLTCILLCASLITVIIIFFFKYIAAAFLPFLTAYSFAIALKGPSDFISKHAKIPQKAARIFTSVAVTFVVGYIGFLIASVLIREGKALYFRITDDKEQLEGAVSELLYMIRRTVEKIPYFGDLPAVSELTQNIDEKILSFASGFAPQIISGIGAFIGWIAKSVPYFALFLLVTAVSLFYFVSDLDNINRTLVGFFPEKGKRLLFLIKNEIFEVIHGYFRAYSLIIALTFSELFVGLSIIGTEYAFLISFLIAIVDVLPVLGAGVILIPWGTVLLIIGNIRDGACIIVLYLIITVIRQMAEPKIVGGFLGLHPLCTLMAVYVGARLAGFAGIFLFPICTIVARNVYCKIRCGNIT